MLFARQKRIPYIMKALRLVPLIRDMNDVDLLRIAEAVKVELFKRGATVSKQVGDYLNGCLK